MEQPSKGTGQQMEYLGKATGHELQKCKDTGMQMEQLCNLTRNKWNSYLKEQGKQMEQPSNMTRKNM